MMNWNSNNYSVNRDGTTSNEESISFRMDSLLSRRDSMLGTSELGSMSDRPLPYNETVSVPEKILSKPRRSLNSYNLFFQHHRRLVIEENGGVGFGNLAREISARWKKVTKDEKAHFDRLAQLDKERHAREMKQWEQQQEEEEHSRREEENAKRHRVQLVDSNPFLTDSANLRRLAHNLGADCTEWLIQALK